MKRREFLLTVAAGSALKSWSLPVSGIPRLGICTYTFRKFPRAEAIRMAKETGVKCVNIKDVHLSMKISAAEQRAAAQEFRDAGLEIVAGGTIGMTRPDEALIRGYFEYARNCGMPVIVAAPSRETLPIVEKMAKEFDIRIAIHNHGPEDKHFPSPYDVLDAVKGMDARMGLCMDVGHALRAGADVVKAAADAGPRLYDIHIKDLKDPKGRASQCVVGQGVMPVAGLFRQLRKMNYRYTVDLEYEIQADDPLPGAKESIAFMKGVVEKLGV
jgi:sugar phosphate isomerase/epimerase